MSKTPKEIDGQFQENQDLELLFIKATDQSWQVRVDAIGKIGKLTEVRAVELLLQALQSEDSNVRMVAIEALGNIGDARALVPLIEALGDTSSLHVSNYAAKALIQIGDKNITSNLLKCFNSDNGLLREKAAQVVAKLEGIDQSKFIQLLENEKDWRVRSSIIITLGEIGEVEVLKPLIEALNDENERVRYQAARGLWQWAERKRYQLLKKAELKGSKIIVTEALEAVESLVKTLQDEDANVRFVAARALASIGDSQAYFSVEKAFETGLLDPENYIVAEILGRLGGKQALRLLKEMDTSIKADVRQSATYGYGCIDEDNSVQLLIKALKDEDEAVRGSAAFNLTTFGNKQALKPLIEALHDQSNWVRLRAADALGFGYFDDPEAVPPLIEALRDKDEEVREMAVEGLGYSNQILAIELLLDRLKDENEDMRERAIRILERISLEAESDEVKIAAKAALG